MSEGGGSGFLQVGGEEEEEVAELSQTPDPPSPTHTHTHTTQPKAHTGPPGQEEPQR